MNKKSSVTIEEDHISIQDAKGEIVYWDENEWKEDPSLVPKIAHAIFLALTDGPARVRKILLGR